MATISAPGHHNEDFAAASPSAVVLLDGAGLSGVDDGGCRHGVAWYTSRLGSSILHHVTDARDSDLPGLLAQAIIDTAQAHRTSCDLSHPGTPSATAIIARTTPDTLDYLVLADSTLAIEHAGRIEAITDDREAIIGRRHRAAMDAAIGGSTEHDAARRAYIAGLRDFRNQPEGFWVAAADPDAAAHSITGHRPLAEVDSIMLLSDGASRPVDRFGLLDWSQAHALVKKTGPYALIQAVRDAENSDPHGQRWPRGKIHDDATVVFCDGLSAPRLHTG
jgi:hypothetical protein